MRDLIVMDQREFNRQMGSYLRDRKDEEGFWARVKKKLPSVKVVDDEKEPVQAPDEVPVEQVEAVMRGESLPKQEPDEDDEGSFEEYEDIPSEGFFERLSKRLFGSFEKSELLHEEEVDVAVVTEYQPKPEVDDDVKAMLRSCVRWINRLPPEDIQAIKREDEYREFKRLLDKYGLIKK